MPCKNITNEAYIPFTVLLLAHRFSLHQTGLATESRYSACKNSSYVCGVHVDATSLLETTLPPTGISELPTNSFTRFLYLSVSVSVSLSLPPSVLFPFYNRFLRGGITYESLTFSLPFLSLSLSLGGVSPSSLILLVN